jgi:hypothetical protein
MARYFLWADQPIRRQFNLIRAGKGSLWECADGPNKTEYQKQVWGEVMRMKKDVDGVERWKWVKRRANHAFDLALMFLAACHMHPKIKFGGQAAEQPTEEK